MLNKISHRDRDLDFPGGEVASSEMFAAFRSFVRRRLGIIVSLVCLAVVPATIYVVATPPSFTASATLIIDPRSDPVRKQSGTPEQTPDSQFIDSQVEILKSERIALAVIKQFDLIHDPDFIGPGDGPIGMLVRWISGWREWLGVGEGESERDPSQLAAEAFANWLTVKRVGLTSIIEVSFRAAHPDRAAEIANATVSAYIADQLEAKSEAAKRAAAWLQDRIQELAAQSTKAEQAAVDYKVSVREEAKTSGCSMSNSCRS
jgi:succinoglycan biosynthesis transport protein ExoP